MSRGVRVPLGTLLAGAVLAGVTGCQLPKLPRLTQGQVVSAGEDTKLTPDLEYRAYTYQSANNADVFLTDIPPDQLDTPEEIARASGQIVHVRMFLRPRPGRTPIDPTACTCTVRYAVLAEGRAGLYAGGGFIIPDNSPGKARWQGRVPRTVLSLAGKTDGFVDPLGESVFRLSFRTRENEERAEILRAAMDRIARGVTPVEGVTAEQLLEDYRWVDLDEPGAVASGS